jgi:dihydrofolate synthase/folylpolyglutamate synthase
LSDPLGWLFGLEQFGIKFGLESITRLVAEMDSPHRAFHSIHIGGTNGKGSTTAMVDAALRAAGHRAGRYTSPHLVQLNERFVIDGRSITYPELESAADYVRSVVERLIDHGKLQVLPTFFEATTAIAFELFRRATVDVAVCEVGLGGRLDATNVLVPAVTAITSIGLDHQRYLGTTLSEIAFEKAGIIKRGVPVVVGRLDPEPFRTIAAVARERGAPVIQAAIGDFADVPLRLRGAHQADNAAVAVSVLQAFSAQALPVPAGAIRQGLAHAEWPGRLDIRRLPDGHEVLLDAAHNVDGATALARFLDTSPFRGAPLVFGAARDKDVDEMLRVLIPVVGPLLLTRASTPRAFDPAELAQRVSTFAPRHSRSVVPSPSDALARASHLSPRVIVAGSIFLLGDVMNEAGWS